MYSCCPKSNQSIAMYYSCPLNSWVIVFLQTSIITFVSFFFWHLIFLCLPQWYKKPLPHSRWMLGRYIFGGTCYHCSKHHHSPGDRELSLYNSEEFEQYMHLLHPFEVFLRFVPGADLGCRLVFVDGVTIVCIFQDLLWDLAASQINPRDPGLSTLGLPVFGILALFCPMDWLSFGLLFWGPELRKSLVLVPGSELGSEFRDLFHPEWI